MKDYEILFIMKPNIDEEKYNKTVDTFEKWITSEEGKIIELEKVGIRDLASTLNSHDKGYYVLCQFSGTNKTIDNIKKRIGVNEIIFRHLLVTLDSVETPQEAVKED